MRFSGLRSPMQYNPRCKTIGTGGTGRMTGSDYNSCTGVSGIYAWQGYYKRRLTITTNATVILRERMRTHVSSREPKELRVLGTNPLKAFLFEGSTQCHKILRLHLSPRLNCIGAPHFAQDDRLWQESGTGVSGNYA